MTVSECHNTKHRSKRNEIGSPSASGFSTPNMMRKLSLASLGVMIFNPNNALAIESFPCLRGSFNTNQDHFLSNVDGINSPTRSFELLDFIEEMEDSSNDKLIIDSPISSSRFEETQISKPVLQPIQEIEESVLSIDEQAVIQDAKNAFVVNESIEPQKEVDVSNQGSWSRSRWHRKTSLRKSASIEKGSWSLYTRAWYWVGIIFLVEVEV